MAEDKTQNTGIEVLEPVIEKYVFSKPLQGDEAKEVYKEVRGRVKKDFKNAPVFNAHFQFNEQTGEINGSNTYYGILINEVLSETCLWLPTITQAKKLDALGRLSNGVYRDFGVAVYSNNNPNQKTAERLIKEANKRAWQLPILAPFKALGLIKTGIKITFKKDAEGIITGEEARQYLDKQFNYKGNTGACGLDRGRNGSWDADWDRLDYSDADGRVDFVCGEATAKNLESAILTDINALAQDEAVKFNQRISSAKEAAIKILKG